MALLSLMSWGTEQDTKPVCFTRRSHRQRHTDRLQGTWPPRRPTPSPVDRKSPQKHNPALDTQLSGGGGKVGPCPVEVKMAQWGRGLTIEACGWNLGKGSSVRGGPIKAHEIWEAGSFEKAPGHNPRGTKKSFLARAHWTMRA